MPRLNSFRNELSQRKGSALLAGAWLLATAAASAEPKTQARATFAGGCFWSMEAAFDKVKGVLSTTSGFAGGNERNPTYEQVASGRTGHAEVVQVVFDPAKVPYAKLARGLLEERRPLRCRRAVLRPRPQLPHGDLLRGRGAEAVRPWPRRKAWKGRAGLPGRSSPRSCRSRPSIPPRPSTRTSTSARSAATGRTAPAAAARPGQVDGNFLQVLGRGDPPRQHPFAQLPVLQQLRRLPDWRVSCCSERRGCAL